MSRNEGEIPYVSYFILINHEKKMFYGSLSRYDYPCEVLETNYFTCHEDKKELKKKGYRDVTHFEFRNQYVSMFE